MRPAHHRGGVTEVARIANVAFGERDVDVPEPLGQATNSASVVPHDREPEAASELGPSGRECAGDHECDEH